MMTGGGGGGLLGTNVGLGSWVVWVVEISAGGFGVLLLVGKLLRSSWNSGLESPKVILDVKPLLLTWHHAFR